MLKTFVILLLLFTNLFSKEIYKVGFAQDTLANDWRKVQALEVKSEASKYRNLQLTIKDANGNLAQQISDIEYFIKNDYDFIITSPINAKISSIALKKAMKKGIKVILIDRGIDTKDYTTFISPDNTMIAQKAAQYIIDKLNGKGTILMLEGVKGATPTILRSQGFMKAVSKYPNIKVIKRTANYLRADAIKVTNDLFKEGIEFDAVFSQSDSMLIGFRTVLEKEKIKKRYITVGIDYIKAANNAIKEGTQNVSFIYNTCGKEGIQAIVDIINGKKLKKDYILNSQMITINNVHKIKPIF